MIQKKCKSFELLRGKYSECQLGYRIQCKSADGIEQNLLSEQRELKKRLQLDCERLKRYFPKEYTLKQCEGLLLAKVILLGETMGMKSV